MPTHYTAADLLAIADGRISLRRERTAATRPLPRRGLKPAVLVGASSLPAPRSRLLSAADILRISRHAQPWHALTLPSGPQSAAG